MQFKKIYAILIGFSVLTHQAYAFSPLPFSVTDLCATVEGKWAGTGKVSTVIYGNKINCEYEGTAIVSKTSTAYSADVNLKKKSGSLCPASESYTVPGTCDGKTGIIILKDEKTNLIGKLSDNSTKAHFEGTVTIPIKNKELIAVVEDMNLHKV